ncbi:MAG TPA: tripartite tricarboxylate transporter substrate binding protein [Burkholderiales bacterium]|nr:tripartite tricarboxylate transporter substrate binding protein [Burkholderiales bacterium]
MCTLLRVAVLAGAIAAPAAAQTFPDRPLRIVVAFSTGTAADIVARQVAVKLTDSLGKQVVVENRDGAAGTIGAGLVARATPDGHTMLIASPSIIVSPLLIKDLPYDVTRDFAPVALMAMFPTVLVVGTQTKAATVKELLDLAKSMPGKLNYANAGRGTASHLSAELMRSMTGVNIVEVAYRATSQALNDTISGEVAMYFPNLASALPSIRAGRLRGLAVTGAQRSQAAPDIPALAETLPGYEAASWYGIVVPTRTPPAVIARLHSEIARALQQPDVKQRFLNLGGDIVSGGPDDMAKTIRSGTEKWGRLVNEIESQRK